MIVPVLLALVAALIVLHAANLRLGQVERTVWAKERASLLRAVIAKHAGEAAALEVASQPRTHRPPRAAREEDVPSPPPGTQAFGLDGC